MEKDQFVFELEHRGVYYHCSAVCLQHGISFQYVVDFTAGGSGAPADTTGRPAEVRNRVIVGPARNEHEHWTFTCEDGGNALCRYPCSFLEHLGMEVDKHNLLTLI